MPSLEDFRGYVGTIRSKNTADTYYHGAKRFVTFLKAKNLTIPSMPFGVLSDFVTYCIKDLRMEPRSAQLYVVAIRTFLTWLEDHGTKIPDYNLKPKLPTMSKFEREPLSQIQLERFHEACIEDIPDPFRTAMMILPYTGMRVSECVGLPSSAIYKSNDEEGAGGYCLRVTGKGNKTRTIPLVNKAVELIKTYQKNYRRKIKSEWMFPAPDDPTIHIHRLSLARYCASIRKKVKHTKLSPHILRHSFATMLIRKNVNLAIIKDLLGHSDIGTTMIYVHPSVGDMRSAVNKIGGDDE